MFIFVLVLGIIVVGIGWAMLMDGYDTGFLISVLGFLIILISALIVPENPRYDVRCGERIHENVTLQIEKNYLKIKGDNGYLAYEDGPCDWVFLGE